MRGQKQLGFWSWAPARVLGTVQVEADGSAHFRVPAERGRLLPGPGRKPAGTAADAEPCDVPARRGSRSCRGCHETQNQAPAVGISSLAMRRGPEIPSPPPWGNQRLLGYEWLIQPILDRHCTRCHGAADPEGGIDLSATPERDGFCRSYRTLLALPSVGVPTNPPAKPLVVCSDRFSGAAISGTQQFGSHRSPFHTGLAQ